MSTNYLHNATLRQREYEESVRRMMAEENERQRNELPNLYKKVERSEKLKEVGITYLNPRDNSVYVADPSNPNKLPFDDPSLKVYDFNEEKQAIIKTASGGKYNTDQIRTHGFTQEWEDHAAEYFAHLENANKGDIKAAGIITSTAFSTLNTVNIYGDLLDQQLKQYTLPTAVTEVATNELDIRIDTYDRFTIDEDIGELVSPTTRQGRFSSATYNLRKAAGHISWSDEAEMRSREHDVIGIHRQNAITDLPRVKAVKVAAKLATASTTAGGTDWTAYTTDHSTANPAMQIYAAQAEIYANNGFADTIVTNTKTYLAYTSNTNIRGTTGAMNGTTPVSRVIQNPQGLAPEFTWYIDESVATGTVYIYDKRAVMLLQGPVRSETYRLPIEGASGFLVRDWHAAAVRTAGQLRKLTAVAS